MRIFTIGFTKTTASDFFGRITKSGATKIVDVRLNNVSQLSGFAKRDDLKFFAERISQVSYEHLTCLAPDQKMLDKYKKHKGSWESYAAEFLSLMRQRKIENLRKSDFDGACLLCSEDTPHHCHRRLVVEYLSEHWDGIEIKHL